MHFSTMDATENPAATFPKAVYYELVRTLRGKLPPPETDAPEDVLRRDQAAIAQVAALVPANAAEAYQAATYVASNAYAMDCIELARTTQDPDKARQCGAQCASVMRQAQGALRNLLRMQEARRKLEANNVATDRAAWTEHCALQLMAQSLPGQAVKVQAEQQESPPPVPPAEPVVTPLPSEEPVPLPIAEAEHYAILYPARAALIRRHGRVPADARFGPPEDEIVHALVTGRTPPLMALDRQPPQQRAA